MCEHILSRFKIKPQMWELEGDVSHTKVCITIWISVIKEYFLKRTLYDILNRLA